MRDMLNQVSFVHNINQQQIIHYKSAFLAFTDFFKVNSMFTHLGIQSTSTNCEIMHRGQELAICGGS